MRTTRWIPLLFAGVASVASAAAPPAAARPVLPWIEDDYGRALSEAKAKKRPIFVEAWAPW